MDLTDDQLRGVYAYSCDVYHQWRTIEYNFNKHHLVVIEINMIYKYLVMVLVPSGTKIKDANSGRLYKLPSNTYMIYFDEETATQDIDRYYANSLVNHCKNTFTGYIHILKPKYGTVHVPNDIVPSLGEPVGGSPNDLQSHINATISHVSVFHDQYGYHVVGPGMYITCDKTHHHVFEL